MVQIGEMVTMLKHVLKKHVMLLFCGRRNGDLKTSATDFIYSFSANSLQCAETHKMFN